MERKHNVLVYVQIYKIYKFKIHIKNFLEDCYLFFVHTLKVGMYMYISYIQHQKKTYKCGKGQSFYKKIKNTKKDRWTRGGKAKSMYCIVNTYVCMYSKDPPLSLTSTP